MDTSNWFQSTGVEEENAISSVPSSPPSMGEMITCSSTSEMAAEKRMRPIHEQALNCPRCDSTHTKFCYYNNYSLSQPRYFCKTCRRYWTKGGTLRNVPVGGGCRKNKKQLPSCSKNKGALNDHPPPDSIVPTTSFMTPITSTDLHLPTHIGIPSFAHFNSYLHDNSDAMECKYAAAMPMFTGERYMMSTSNLDDSRLDLMMGSSVSSPAGSYYSFNQMNGSSDERFVGSRGGSCNSIPFGVSMDPFGSSELYHHESCFPAESNIGSQHKLMQLPSSSIRGAQYVDDHANTIEAKPSLLALEWHGHDHQFGTSYARNFVFGKDSLNFNPAISGIGGWPGMMNIDGAYISSSTSN